MPVLECFSDKTLIIIFILFVLGFLLFTYKREHFQTTTSNIPPTIRNYLNELKTSFNVPRYAIIDPRDNQGIYYDLTPKLDKTIDFPIFTMTFNNPSNSDIKHYNNGDISQLEMNRLNNDWFNLVIRTRDNQLNTRYVPSGTYKLYRFIKLDSNYYLIREYYFVDYIKQLRSELFNITNIINNITNEMNFSNIFNLNNSIKDRYPILVVFNPLKIEFNATQDRLLNQTKLNQTINDLKNIVNNYKNLSNIYLDSDYKGLFAQIEFLFKIKSFNNNRIVYSLYFANISERNIFQVQSYKKLEYAQLTKGDINLIVNDIVNNGNETNQKWITVIKNASYTFYYNNNKYYFRRRIYSINGNITSFDKKCDITSFINGLNDALRIILPPIENTTTNVSITDKEILYTININ